MYIGQSLGDQTEVLSGFGIGKVFAYENEALAHYSNDGYVPIVCDLAGEVGATVIIGSSSAFGKELCASVAARLGIELTDQRTNRIILQPRGVAGVLIVGVTPRSGAARAGLRGTEPGLLGDIIVQLDGETVPTIADLRVILDRYQPGDDVEVTIIRDGETRNTVVTLM